AANPKSRPEAVRNVPPVFPLPQEMALEGPPVPLPDSLAIQFEPVNSARAKTTAEVLRDELKLCFGLDATVAPAAPGAAPFILIGEAAGSPATAAALKKAGAAKPLPDSPDGYILAVRPGAIVI
ncbi:MAG TPA: glycoside hydrolase family 20 zincin-like fold domain-containing protein, partial [Candidatus Brocadiia bacterium]|nr:glycoside hydrolase family 20 zincin-like fold domain-containing protein [Candidatus Brocadiia bacterium]